MIIVEIKRALPERVKRPLRRYRNFLRSLFYCWLCGLYRICVLRGVVFVGITGSTGKTTTKELTAVVLCAHLPGGKSPANNNLPRTAARNILRVTPRSRFYVQEVAAAIGGEKVDLDLFLWMLGCRIGVVTNIGSDHLSAFGNMEAIAAAKSKLVRRLPADGTAILNADDPLVLAMAEHCAAKVVTIGVETDADFRAKDVRSAWPEPLTLTVTHKTGQKTVRTQLHGKFWVHSVLAALAVGLEMGLTLEQAVTAVESAGPAPMRMQPVIRDDGVAFLRDDLKAPITSIAPALNLLAESDTKRKFAIIGTLSDYRGNSNRVYVAVARRALAAADRVIFVGPRAHKCLKARKGAPDERLSAFVSVEAAAEHLAGTFQADDLILLKGTPNDRLGMVINHTYARCKLPQRSESQVSRDTRAVVGLGNPGTAYQNTAHNLGHEVLDRLAGDLGLAWQQSEDAQIASIPADRGLRYLIKPQLPVNESGRSVGRLADVLQIPAENWIVVYDDADLPLGEVQWRDSGSDAGHRGLRSVLISIGSSAVPRVRIGVGRKGSESLATSALQRFGSTERAAIEAAIVAAVEHVKAALETDAGIP
jgi:UDP-N-acetylmuramoyl-tripeptide--D-alanyl-D-alanine ligase